jgi:hypothetical protein
MHLKSAVQNQMLQEWSSNIETKVSMLFINEFVSSLEPNVWVVHISQYYLVFKNMNKGFYLL